MSNVKYLGRRTSIGREKYRRQGLAKACIYESMKQCKKLGANVVYVVPDEEPYPWYKSMGFKQTLESYCWSKTF
ncbi:GNAT family N-acetyltransferase [Paenibacillus turicensis]|uniref:GNAT family N-acetyltransferase n=1 Tax=Paenibacillus turicensis TaxID=160487 RepID=UPI003D29B842